MDDEYIIPASQITTDYSRRRSRRWVKCLKRRRIANSTQFKKKAKKPFSDESLFPDIAGEIEDPFIATTLPMEDDLTLDVADIIYFSDSDEESIEASKHCGILDDVKIVEEANKSDILYRNSIESLLLSQGMLPFSQLDRIAMIEHLESTEVTLIPTLPLQSNASNTQRSHLHEAYDSSSELLKTEMKFSQWNLPFRYDIDSDIYCNTLEAAFSKTFERITPQQKIPCVNSVVKCILEDFGELKSSEESPQKKKIKLESHISPEFKLNKNIVRTYSRDRTNKKPATARKLDNYYDSEGSEHSFMSEYSQKPENMYCLNIKDDYVINNARFCKSLQNLSGLLSQNCLQGKSYEFEDEIYKFISDIKKSKIEYKIIDWYRYGYNFKMNNESFDDEFKGFNELESSPFNSSLSASKLKDDDEMESEKLYCIKDTLTGCIDPNSDLSKDMAKDDRLLCSCSNDKNDKRCTEKHMKSNLVEEIPNIISGSAPKFSDENDAGMLSRTINTNYSLSKITTSLILIETESKLVSGKPTKSSHTALKNTEKFYKNIKESDCTELAILLENDEELFSSESRQPKNEDLELKNDTDNYPQFKTSNIIKSNTDHSQDQNTSGRKIEQFFKDSIKSTNKILGRKLFSEYGLNNGNSNVLVEKNNLNPFSRQSTEKNNYQPSLSDSVNCLCQFHCKCPENKKISKNRSKNKLFSKEKKEHLIKTNKIVSDNENSEHQLKSLKIGKNSKNSSNHLSQIKNEEHCNSSNFQKNKVTMNLNDISMNLNDIFNSKNILQPNLNHSEKYIINPQNIYHDDMKNDFTTTGFQFVSGKSVAISEAYLAKAKNMFSDLDNLKCESNNHANDVFEFENIKCHDIENNNSSTVLLDNVIGELEPGNQGEEWSNLAGEVYVQNNSFENNIITKKLSMTRENELTLPMPLSFSQKPIKKSHKARLSLSNKKFKPPYVTQAISTPKKSKNLQASVMKTPNLKEFFNTVVTSTPRMVQLINTDLSQNVNLEEEITPSTTAFIKEEFSIDYSSGFSQKQFQEQWKHVSANCEVSEKIRACREVCRRRQLEFIKCKEDLVDRPISAGYLYQAKSKKNRMAWKGFAADSRPATYSIQSLLTFGVIKEIVEISPSTVLSFKFNAIDFYPEANNLTTGIVVADSTTLIFNDFNQIGFEELKNSFLAIPSVVPRLLPNKWIAHHYKMILTKLSSIEIAFPEMLSRKMCTPENLLFQLKYRYDREIDRAQRSALKKILECDDSPSKRMVLFVHTIIRNGFEIEIYLSDGWYSIKTKIDLEMQNFINLGKVRIGTKLITQSAQLFNCEHGCNPLDVPDNVYLKIHTNSTRRVRWDTKLGFYYAPKVVRTYLNNVLVNGGNIPYLNVLVLRVYPSIYYDRDKNTGNSSFHSFKMEEKLQKEHNNTTIAKAEEIFSQVKRQIDNENKEVTPKNKRVPLRKSIRQIKHAEEIYELIQAGYDEIEADLSSTQKTLLTEYQQSKHEEVERRVSEQLKNLTKNRNVTEVLKVRIIDVNYTKKTAVLSIWRPSEDVKNMLREGIYLEVTNCTPKETRSGELQLSAASISQFKILEKVSHLVSSELFRKVTKLEEILHPENLYLHYGELDTYGIVVEIGDFQMNKFQQVYISDIKGNILSINFWAGLKKYGYDDVIKKMRIIAAYNLEWRRNSKKTDIPIVYATDVSTFTDKPKEIEMRNYILSMKEVLKTSNILQLVDNARDKIKEVNSKLRKPQNCISNVSNNGDRSCSISNLDSNVISPNTQMRLDLLKMYGAAPPISPLINMKSNVNTDYKTPIKLTNELPTRTTS